MASHWIDVGRDGFKIVRFRLEKLDDEALSMGPEPRARSQEPQYDTTTSRVVVRDWFPRQASLDVMVCRSPLWTIARAGHRDIRAG